MLVNFHFCKYQMWNEKKRQLTNQMWRNFTPRSREGTWESSSNNDGDSNKSVTKKCIRAASNLISLIPPRSVRLKTLSKFRKRKRNSHHCVFALHKRELSCRSRAVMAKKCTKNVMPVQSWTYCFLRPQRDFQICDLEKLNIHKHWTRVTRLNPLWVSGESSNLFYQFLVPSYLTDSRPNCPSKQLCNMTFSSK